jgi:uncharacterized protein (UPF0261 family)
MTSVTILVLATLDTKGKEARFVCDQIESLGNRALLMDTGVVGIPVADPDIPRAEVADAGGVSLAKLLEKPSREVAAPVMAAGATRILQQLVEERRVDGAISFGGTQGTTLSSQVMRNLPYGFPKLLVSTMASGNVAPWIDIKDITMMFSVSDIMGLNPFTRKILSNAAGAICGMANVAQGIEHTGKPVVAVTTVGITTRGAMKALETLQQRGYETIVFHANGAGGRAMEQMMKEGFISAVLDYSIIEVSNEIYHAMLAGGGERLTVAGKLGLPQVICPGAVEVLVFGEPDSIPAPYRARNLVRHSLQITDVRLNKTEMCTVAREVALRLGHTKGEAVFLVPRTGFDCYSVEGQDLNDCDADTAFIVELKKCLPANIKVLERNTHIEDPVFATEAAELLISLIEKPQQSHA